MSLFTNPIRPAPIASDAAVRRYVDAIRRQIEPDPLYRRRLRGEVVNRFVAQQQGVDLAGVRRSSPMGSLGRACLYATFALAVSVTGAMAASEAAIPGDLLYPVKRGIETMRLEVLPAQYRDELAAYALSERIGEMSQLVEAGDMARASAFADTVHDAYERAMAVSDDAGALAQRIDRQVAWLEDVLSGLPEQARAEIESAMAGAPGLTLDAWEPGGSDTDAGPALSSGQGNDFGDGRVSSQARGPASAGGKSSPDDGPSPEATPPAEPTPRPDRTPKPEPTPTPEPSPSHDASDAPMPSPKANGNPHAPHP
jgi:hypothetical protein